MCIRDSYYDEETGMYYLKSRYYDPEICRFISADDVTVMIDSPMSLTDKNLYAYCDNDPVNKKDEEGELPQFVLCLLYTSGSSSRANCPLASYW